MPPPLTKRRPFFGAAIRATSASGFTVLGSSEDSFTNAFVEPTFMSNSSLNWTTAFTSTATNSGVTATATMPANTTAAILETSVTGNGVLPPVVGPGADANSYRTVSFTLGGGDSVTFSFNYALNVATAGLPAGQTYFDDVNASVSVNGGGPTNFQTTSLGTNGSKSGPFSYTVTNASVTAVTDTVYLGAASYEYTTAVPEPSTYALMLAGLGLVGVIARRRKAIQA
jgi:hypothetical protein